MRAEGGIAMEMRNYVELVVERHTQTLMLRTGVCSCEKCKLDVMSIALNNLRPHYVVTEAGALYAKMKDFDHQHNVDVTAAVMNAIQKVSERPRH